MEKLVLRPHQERSEARSQPKGNSNTQVAVQLVHRAVSFDPKRVLGHLLTAAEVRVATIPHASVNFGDAHAWFSDFFLVDPSVLLDPNRHSHRWPMIAADNLRAKALEPGGTVRIGPSLAVCRSRHGVGEAVEGSLVGLRKQALGGVALVLGEKALGYEVLEVLEGAHEGGCCRGSVDRSLVLHSIRQEGVVKGPRQPLLVLVQEIDERLRRWWIRARRRARHFANFKALDFSLLRYGAVGAQDPIDSWLHFERSRCALRVGKRDPGIKPVPLAHLGRKRRGAGGKRQITQRLITNVHTNIEALASAAGAFIGESRRNFQVI